MILFDSNQINELTDIVNNFHLIFVAQELGTSVLSDEEIKLLESYGIDVEKLSSEGKIDDAYKFGIFVDALKDERAKDLTYKEFKDFISSGEFLPLTEDELEAVSYIKARTYNDIKGLGNRISADLTRILIESDEKLRRDFEEEIKEKLEEAVLRRKSAAWLTSELGHKTEDWARDFGRISDFIMHDAYDRGKAASIFRRKGEEARVFKKVYKEACEHCVQLYLTNGLGSEPKVFLLKDLVSNGSNIGLKVKDWKAVLGGTHPWCRCETFEYEENTSWNEEDQEFNIIKRNTYGVKRNSKIKITTTL